MKNYLRIAKMFFITGFSIVFIIGCGYMGKDKKQYAKAEKLFSEQKYVLAFKEYKIVLDRFPKSKFYDTSVDKSGKCIYEIIEQSRSLLHKGQVGKAYELHKMILSELSGNAKIDCSKTCAEVYFIIANALFEKKSFSDAIKVYNIGLELDPSNTEAKDKLNIARDKAFFWSVKNAIEFDRNMSYDKLESFHDKLNKVTYGNEFERRRDKIRAEKDYEKIINTLYFTEVEISVEEYNFSEGTLGFKPFGKPGTPRWTYTELISFKPIEFQPLKIDEKRAEEISKNLTYTGFPNPGCFVNGIILFKITNSRELSPGHGRYANISKILDVEVINARINVPKYGYVYLFK